MHHITVTIREIGSPDDEYLVSVRVGLNEKRLRCHDSSSAAMFVAERVQALLDAKTTS